MLHMPIIIKQKSTACLHFAVEENKPTRHEICIYIRNLFKNQGFSLSEDKIITPVLLWKALFLDIVLMPHHSDVNMYPLGGPPCKKKIV